MKLYFSTEGRFVKKDGKYYSEGGFSQKLWDRYLQHFDHICVIARVSKNPDHKIVERNVISDERISFIELDYYVGAKDYLKSRKSIKQILDKQLFNDGVVICRLPSSIGSLVIKALKRKRIAYACEIVGDPWDVFARGGVSHPLRFFLRIKSYLTLKKQVRQSRAVLYVTKYTLQNRYPASAGVFNIGVSDVILKESEIAQSPKTLKHKDSYTIISIGSLAQLYKAPDVVIKSVKNVIDSGIKCNLVWLGGGCFLEPMKKIAGELGISSNVNFLGNVSSQEVLQQLRSADVFVLASRTEGLPRAVVEAMGQGLPCIGTKVGGIPELLDDEVLVEKENVQQLSKLLSKILTDASFANAQANRNLKESQDYLELKLDEKRNCFYKYILNGYENL